MRTRTAPTITTRLLPLALAAAITIAAAGCSDDQKRALGQTDVRESLAAQVTTAADDAGLELDGGLECTASITEDGAVDSACRGTASSGVTVDGTYTGTADVDAETCTADLAVTVDGAPVDVPSPVDCFDVR